MRLVRSILFLLGIVSVIWMAISGDSPVLLVVLGGIYSLAEVIALSVRKIGLAMILKASIGVQHRTLEEREMADRDLEEAIFRYKHE
jgi:hypothetical protein